MACLSFAPNTAGGAKGSTGLLPSSAYIAFRSPDQSIHTITIIIRRALHPLPGADRQGGGFRRTAAAAHRDAGYVRDGMACVVCNTEIETERALTPDPHTRTHTRPSDRHSHRTNTKPTPAHTPIVTAVVVANALPDPQQRMAFVQELVVDSEAYWNNAATTQVRKQRTYIHGDGGDGWMD